MKLIFTIPPSVNHLYRRRGNQTFRSRRYNAWLATNSMTIQNAHPWTDYPCGILITIHGGTGWRINRDLDNTLKAFLDLLQSVGILASDDSRHVQGISITYEPPPKAPKQDAYATLVIYRGGGRD